MPTQDFPIYLFLGEEDFLKEDAINKLKLKYLDNKTKELNYSVFYAGEKDFSIEKMLDALNTLPFMSKKRLVVLRDAELVSTSTKKSILFYLKNPQKSSVFIIESSSPVIKGELLLEASKSAQLFYFRRLTDSGVTSWLLKKASLSGKKISSDAIKLIKENLPRDLRILSSNMENIILYIGKKTIITKGDVEKVIGVSPSHTAFDLIDSIQKKDAKKALYIFSSLKRDRKKEIELIGLLAWRARMLLRVKELLRIKTRLEIRKSLGLSPRMSEEIINHASGFKNTQILSLLEEILHSDVEIKRGMLPQTVMERLIVKMCV